MVRIITTPEILLVTGVGVNKANFELDANEENWMSMDSVFNFAVF